MEALARMIGTIVADSLKADDEMREMMNLKNQPEGGLNNQNNKAEWEIHRRLVENKEQRQKDIV